MKRSTLSNFFIDRHDPFLPRPMTVTPNVNYDADDEDEIHDNKEIALGVAEGQCFAIEYKDSKGKLSTRRITVWSIRESKLGPPSLYARCHERNAMRQFRIDRIQSCIDLDGEVHEPKTFLMEVFGMGDNAWEDTPTQDAISTKRMMEDCIEESILLAAMMHADGIVLEQEIAVASAYCLTLCEQKQGRPLQGKLDSVAKYLRRMNPTHDAILNACDQIVSSDIQRISTLLRALREVMDADGERDDTEITFLNETSRELTGLELI